ncbi:cytosolic protein [Vibrio splendidus]|nr:cytosolic protein [Vibrio splendidus]
MFIHHVNGIDWLVITAFEELKTIFIEEAGTIPSCFSATSELSLIEQAKRNYGHLPTLSGVITDTGTFQRQDDKEDLNPQLACLVEGRGRVFLYGHGGFVAFVDDEQTFITRIDCKDIQ